MVYVYIPSAQTCRHVKGDWNFATYFYNLLGTYSYYYRFITDGEMVVKETGWYVINRICRGQAHLENDLYLKRDYHWFSIYWGGSLTPSYDMQDNEGNAYTFYGGIGSTKVMISKGRVIEPAGIYSLAPWSVGLLEKYLIGWFTQ